MAGIDELSRAIGKLEASIVTLFHKNTDLCKEVRILSKAIQGRKLWDTIKVVSGGFAGGFAAVAAKMAIWK